MESGPLHRRRLVALVAAYALALQALLSAFVPVMPPALAAQLAALCSHDSGSGPGHPVQHELPCAAACAALGHGIEGPPPPAVVLGYAVPLANATPAPAGDWVVPRIIVRGPQAPRGPPLA